MKTLSITFLFLFILSAVSAQNYIGKDWVTVQYKLASKKTSNSKLYVALEDRDSINHVYHTISLGKNDETKKRDWVLIQTYFTNGGYCNMEIYADLGSKVKALAQAKLLLKNCKLVYSSSKNHGLMDSYVVTKNGNILGNMILDIGSTVDLPNDIMLIIGDKNIK